MTDTSGNYYANVIPKRLAEIRERHNLYGPPNCGCTYCDAERHLVSSDAAKRILPGWLVVGSALVILAVAFVWWMGGVR